MPLSRRKIFSIMNMNIALKFSVLDQTNDEIKNRKMMKSKDWHAVIRKVKVTVKTQVMRAKFSSGSFSQRFGKTCFCNSELKCCLLYSFLTCVSLCTCFSYFIFIVVFSCIKSVIYHRHM